MGPEEESADLMKLVGARANYLTRKTGADIKVFSLVEGEERYVFLYDDVSKKESLRVLGRFASNPNLSFTWYDAAVLSKKIREESWKVKKVNASRFGSYNDTLDDFHP